MISTPEGFRIPFVLRIGNPVARVARRSRPVLELE